jgi:predicted transcriptional regulator
MGPEDIELGDEPVEVERRPRSGVVLSVRLSPDEADQLQTLAAQRRVPLSTVAREAIVTYLTNGPLARPSVAPWFVSGQTGHITVSYAKFGSTARTAGRGTAVLISA